MATPTGSATSQEAAAKIKALMDGPAGTPPVGVLSNFNNPPNLDTEIILTLALCMAVATLAVTMRMYTKIALIKSLAYEDYVIVTSWALTVGLLVSSIYIMVYGGGVHIWDLRLKTFLIQLHWDMVNAAEYIVVITLIKVSILLQYLRIFVPNRRVNMPLYVGIQVFMWSLVVFYLVHLILTVTPCIPQRKFWDPFVSGRCIDVNALYQSSGVVNVLSDFAILILPVKPILSLQMPLRRKISTIAIFATGALACATSILRTRVTWQSVNSPDKSYLTVVEGLWTWAEVAIGTFVSCVPVLPRFLHQFSSKSHKSFTFSSMTSRLLTSSKHVTAKARDIFGLSTHATKQSGGSNSSANLTESDEYKGFVEGRYLALDDFDKLAKDGSARKDATRRNDIEQAISRA